MELIDKNKLLEELEKLKQNLSASPIVVIENVESLVESLEVKEVEYTRTDTFIEKAVSYLDSKLYDWVRIEHPNPSVSPELIIKQDFIKDFKNYMKGE